MAIETVAGDVSAATLGFTSMHEHVACWFTAGVRENYLWDVLGGPCRRHGPGGEEDDRGTGGWRRDDRRPDDLGDRAGPHLGPWQIASIAQLCQEGFGNRMTLAIDSVQTADFDMLHNFEGPIKERNEVEWALAYLPTAVVPALRDAGVSEVDIKAMTIDNPARLMQPALNTEF